MPSARIASTTTLSGIAKELYPVEEIGKLEQLHTVIKKEFSETSDLNFSAASGGTFKFAVKAYGPHGQKMVNEQEQLPLARASNVVQGTASVKEYVGVLQFTKRELELARKDASSFADVKTMEMEGLIENAAKYFNRQIAAGQGTGTMTLVSGAQSAQTVIEVDDATPFQIGMVIDIWDSTGVTKQVDGVVVTDIDMTSATNTITIDTSSSCDDNGIITLAGVRDNMSTDGKEMVGLPLVVDDGTLAAAFQGITRATTPNYKGISLSAASGPLSESLINQLVTRAYRVGGIDFMTKSDVFWAMSPEQWRSYVALSTPQYRFSPGDAGDMNKNLVTYEIMGKRVVLDPDIDRTRVYIMTKRCCKIGVARALDWEEDLGGTTLKWLSGTTQGVMVLYALQQMFSEYVREAAAVTSLASVAV